MSAAETSGLILGIESSCDETAAAVVRAGEQVYSNVVASQIALHANYGGVVPELASREHLRNIVPVVREAVREAGCSLCATSAPSPSPKAPASPARCWSASPTPRRWPTASNVPLIGVNHLEGHIHAVLMEARQRADAPMELPLLALVVSGGHTHLYLATQKQPREAPGATRTSAAPSTTPPARPTTRSPSCSASATPAARGSTRLAPNGNPRAVPFQFGQIKPRAPRPGISLPNKKAGAERTGPTFDFSFSGIKTAVLRYVETHGMKPAIERRRAALAELSDPKPSDAAALCDAETLDLIASFQYAVVGNLERQAFAAAEAFGARGIVVSGGVAANRELRQRFLAQADRRGLPVAFPSLALSTDNAAMIAAAAWPKFLAGDFADDSLVATPQLRLG